MQQSTFIVSREDRAEDPKTLVAEGLRIGRLQNSDIWLNHPTVSRLHAGVNEIAGYFYLINLSASSATTLNGRVIPFNEAEALTDGDEIQIGPFFLKIDHSDGAFRITVVIQFALNVGERKPVHKVETYKKQINAARRVAGKPEVSSSLKIWWDDKRTREKAGRLSPLHPRTPPLLGKAQFAWMPTRDLVRPWPFAIFIWAVIVIGTLSAVAAVKYKIAFAPKRISASHTRTAFAMMPAIAKQASGGSCTSCHAIGVTVANKEKMNANCAACHQSEAFVANIIPAHREAGLICTNCHSEHRGANLGPTNAALESCANCHADKNKTLYNGKSVHTAHRGSYGGYGYPFVEGVWVWKGLDNEDLARKPGLEGFAENNRVNSTQTQQWRNAQFHAIHIGRLRVVEGVDGTLHENGVDRVLSCSSCHKTGYMGSNIDRENPRKTCQQCHNMQVFNEPSSTAMKAKTPSCTSCHVQHTRDMHWASSLRIAQAEVPASSEVVK
jgi:hypothetical protein